MIRNLKKNDMNDVMNIWLKSNITTHYFISEDYWKKNEDFVRDAISKAETYVYEENNIIKGFIGLVKDYVAGIFVKEEYRSKGIGKSLLNYCKEKHTKLKLKVYEKNEKAIRFYERENIEKNNELIDELTKEKEYYMIWKKTSN